MFNKLIKKKPLIITHQLSLALCLRSILSLYGKLVR